MDLATNGDGNPSQNAAAKGAALLLVIGEPFSEEHKKLILSDVTKGFRSWDCEATGIDINDELAQIANRADLGEEGPNASPYGNQLKEGERVIRHQSDKVAVEILVNPQTQTVSLAVKTFLATPTKHKQLIYAGHTFQGTGAWILQDDTYTFSNFSHAFKDQDVDNAVRQQGGTTLYIHTSAEGNWSNGHISKNDFSKLLDVKHNPAEKLDSVHGVMQFTAYISNFVRVRELNELLQSSDVVGNIRFSRPTLYIFPGCQGDSALFGISGFNLLVNGGYSRKACFWDFTRHLDRIDAALMTHLGSDNLYGFKSVLQRKSIENVHPEIGFMYVNASDKIKPIAEAESGDVKDPTLEINLAEEGNKLVQFAKQIGQAPQPCSRSMSGQTIEPLNLYHKVGIGSLDMYILNPITDSKELKDFYQQWNQKVAQFGINQHVPLPNTLSVCALLVWRPSDPNDNITRIFFPGNAPQHKVLEGLEKLKSLDILKHAACTKVTLSAKPAKKPTGLASKPPARSKVSPVNTPRNEVPKRETTPRSEVPKKDVKTAAAPKPSVPKAKKEDVNKKTMKAPEKTPVSKLEKPKDKASAKTTPSKAPASAKSSTPSKTFTPSKTSTPSKVSTPSKTSTSSKSSTPSKGSAKSSTTSTPKGSTSPVKEKENVAEVKVEPPKAHSPEPVQQRAVPDLVDLTPKEPEPVMNGGHEPLPEVQPQAPILMSSEPLQAAPAGSEEPTSLIDVTPEAVPEPALPESEPAPQAMDKNKMLELGIYDEDEDIEEDLNAQQPSEGGGRVPQMFGSLTGSMHQDLMGDFNAPPPQHNLMQGSFHEDLMAGSMHEAMFDNKHPFDGPTLMENGGTNVDEILTPDDDTSEEIQPQALPEPVAYAPESYGQEPDVIPNIMAKEEPDELVETQTTPVAQEPDLLSMKQEVDDSDKYEEESTVPVEDKQPQALDTPDEVENVLPEDDKIQDVEEKDVSEDNEKNVAMPSEPEQELIREPSPALEPEEDKEIPAVKVKAVREPSPAFDSEDENKEIPAGEVETVREPSPALSLEDEKEEMPVVEAVREPSPALDSEDENKEIPAVETVREPSPALSSEDEKEGTPAVEVEAVRQPSPIMPEVQQDVQCQPDFESDEEFQKDEELIQQEMDAPAEASVPQPDLLADEPIEIADRAEPQAPMEPDFGIPPEADNEPELQEAERVDSPDIPDIIERPHSPEPLQAEQDQLDEKLLEQEIVDSELESRPVANYNIPEDDGIEDDFNPNEDLPVEQEVPRQPSPTVAVHSQPEDMIQDQGFEQEENIEQGKAFEQELPPVMTEAPQAHPAVQETHDSEEERADSPDSQLGARDSLDREIGQNEESPFSEEDMQRDSMERNSEERDSAPRDSEERDSEERDSIDREVEEVKQDPLDIGENQRESAERSFEDDSDEETEETDDEEDDESSSFEQEENTDEKCLIPENKSEDQRSDMESADVKAMETDNLAAPLADQPSDSLLTPESEYTDAIHGGQVGYHEVDEQDGDSVEGMDERDQLSGPAGQQPGYQYGDDFEQFGAPPPAMASGPMSTNPFGNIDQLGTNPFVSGFDQPPPPQNVAYSDSEDDEVSPSGGPAGFNPLAEWGEPMGLPSPAPPEDKATAKTDTKKPGADAKKADAKRPGSAANKRPTSATKTSPPASNGVPEKSKSKPAGALNSSRTSTNTSRLSMGAKTAATTKSRPATAPAKDRSSDDLKNKPNGTRRPATAAGTKSAPAAVKMPALPPFTPFYMDLTYIPAHGNPSYSDVEFFKRIRARYYVLSALSPNTQVLDALIEGKNTWEDKSLSVTVIPTYDNETLRLWMTLHKEKLADAKVEIAPSASRCTIQLQDHETSSSAYRLEF